MTEEAFTALERELSLLMRRARARSEELARQVHPDIDGTAYVLLATVASTGGMRASELAARFGVDKGAISRQVARLEQLGLVTRAADPDDRRALVIGTTSEGQRRVEAAVARRRERFRARLSDWTDDDVEQLADLLSRYNASFE